MARIGVEGLDLLGMPDDEATPAEFFALGKILSEQTEILSRAEWCFENLPMYDTQMFEMEEAQLLYEAMYAYIYGLDALVIIAASAFCEKLLSDAIESCGDRKSAKGSLGKILKSSHILKIVNPYLLDRIKRLHLIRNNFCHERDEDNEYRIFRRAVSERQHHTVFLKNDAREALCIMKGLAAQVPRQFPRSRIEGVGSFNIRTEHTRAR